mmetsp:Transcript_13884/g.20969  ORF Transcript_13884/g.20969 Transcript_13884/m.20969 type:complete len:1648 (-) Transcript_13884:93-5036(-)|eukprot:CAMPEP_0167761338 /NCGR_PEP_ID=MMETSP0110_2-20121227/12112_1 /TAXON_ID=629695 /ORGANISM="Gymnochlora sp., Strain CCMP2014" /LENGTH=1647 /DNA_ID=CAMNT_0007648001 /DNA_START=29 /DNA_END=4972 /DNA_ORIENTATION=+
MEGKTTEEEKRAESSDEEMEHEYEQEVDYEAIRRAMLTSTIVLDTDSKLYHFLHKTKILEIAAINILCHGQRFIHLVKNKMGFWRKRKCHLILSSDMQYLDYSAIKGENVGMKMRIPTTNIVNIASGPMYNVPNRPNEFKDAKTFSLIILKDPGLIQTHPKTSIMHFTPDINCVQIGEVVEFTEQSKEGEISKDGIVVEYNLENPSVVLVGVLNNSTEVISVVGETLNRNGELNTVVQEKLTRACVWDWYIGLLKVKQLLADFESFLSGLSITEEKRQAVDQALSIRKTRKAWHNKVLTYGNVFLRAFVGPKFKETKIIPQCYLRCSTNLKQILYVSKTMILNNSPNIMLKDESDHSLEQISAQLRLIMAFQDRKGRPKTGGWSLSKFNTEDALQSPSHRQRLSSQASTPQSKVAATPHSKNVSSPALKVMSSPETGSSAAFKPTSPKVEPKRKGTAETLALMAAGSDMYHENLVRQMVAGANAARARKRRFSTRRDPKDSMSPFSSRTSRTSSRLSSRQSSAKNSMSPTKKNWLRRTSRTLGSRSRGNLTKGGYRKIKVLEVKDLAEILTGTSCPAFRGCLYSIGLRFKGKKKDTIISFECRSKLERDRWHRQFRYLKEVRGGVTMPVNVRAGFRMQGDLKWQGSFEEHFEFLCPSYHKMLLEVGNRCKKCVCKICDLKADRNTVFFHVCPKCDYAMCTKCAKNASKIGEGGFSEVHLAINKNMVDKPPCVIKIFKNMMGHSTLKKMVMETNVLFSLQAHPNIVKYQGYGGPNENGQLWMVMEFCDGGSVLDLRKGMKTLMAESHIAYIIHCVLRALAFLHEKKIAHKDIKAANILLTKTGFVKLSDFGISEQVKQNNEVLEFAGSPLWMPPEAYMGEKVDEKGDIWSLGITAIELAEGQAPFFGQPIHTLAQSVVNKSAPKLRSKSALDKPKRNDDPKEWSKEFKSFLAQCFEKDPKMRPSAARLLEHKFMDEEQFKLTTFCDRIMNVMQDAGIFEINNGVNNMPGVGDRFFEEKHVPALICRKSLLYLIKNKNYKEVIQKDDLDSKADKVDNASIRKRLYGKGSMLEKETNPGTKARKKKTLAAYNKNADITKWDFMQTMQKEFTRQRRATQSSRGKTRTLAIPKFELDEDLTKTREEKKDTIKIPSFELEEDLTKTKDSTMKIPMIRISEDLTKTKTSPGLPIPLMNLTEDLTKTQQNVVEVVKTNETMKTESTEKDGKKHISLYSPRFLPAMQHNNGETFRITKNKNDARTYKSKNVHIDEKGQFYARGASSENRKSELGPLYMREDLVHIRHLGRGASGFVVKSLHLPSRKFVALKHMSIDNSKMRHQLDKELTAFVKVQHPQVVTLNGAYLEGERIVICLEYMDLGSLDTVVSRRKTIPEKMIGQMAKQALEGLKYIHKKKFIHRDIKPDNFLVSSRGEVKVADFGLMRQLRDGETGAYTKTGTVYYLSPERIAGAKFTHTADIWAVGITLIYCATGELPVPRDFWNLVDFLTNRPSPSLDRKKFSKDFCDFIDLCMIKDPTKRADAGQLLKHPFMKTIASKEQLSEYLGVEDKKSLNYRARHEATLLVREVWYNRDKRHRAIFQGSQDMANLAEQLRTEPEYLKSVVAKGIAYAETTPNGARVYEFWKPSRKSLSLSTN